jgi:hypothetical protein
MVMSRHQNAGQSSNKKTASSSFWKYARVQIFRNDNNESKFDSWVN